MSVYTYGKRRQKPSAASLQNLIVFEAERGEKGEAENLK